MSKQSNTPPQSRYESTQMAWENIWSEANIEVELEVVRSTRSMQTINAYLPYLDKNEAVLEAGSGLSAVILTLRDMGYRVIGLDYALNALETSKAYDPQLDLTGGDVHKLPIADNSVGAYLSFGVFEHFETGMQLPLQEAFRILKPNGTLVMTIPYPNLVNRAVAWRRKAKGQSVLTDEDFYESTYTHTQLIDEIQRVGFETLLVKPTSHAYTLWGLGGPFRSRGYYKTSKLADTLGTALRYTLPWAMNFMTLIVGRKPNR